MRQGGTSRHAIFPSAVDDALRSLALAAPHTATGSARALRTVHRHGPARVPRLDHSAECTTPAPRVPLDAGARCHSTGVADPQGVHSAYEWGVREDAALKFGLEPAVIDVVRRSGPVTTLSGDDALIVDFGRQLFRNRHVDSRTFAALVERLGRQGAFDAIMLLAYPAMTGVLQRAGVQQSPSGFNPVRLPALAGIGTPTGPENSPSSGAGRRCPAMCTKTRTIDSRCSRGRSSVHAAARSSIDRRRRPRHDTARSRRHDVPEP
jgi:hypothetical protein